MFQYAGEVSMSLKYNSSRKQIVFSHLAPNTPDPTLENQFQYYGPDGSFDALEMKKVFGFMSLQLISEEIRIKMITLKNQNLISKRLFINQNKLESHQYYKDRKFLKNYISCVTF